MKVLFAGSECSPVVKVGGLGDVMFSLPKSLIKKGLDIRVVIPAYEVIPEEFKNNLIMQFDQLWGGRSFPVKVFLTDHPDYPKLKIYLLQNSDFLDAGGDTAFAGNQSEVNTYAFFSKAVVSLVAHLAQWSQNFSEVDSWIPQIIHCHDWHTGIIPQMLKFNYGLDPILGKLKTVLTIHNLSYQGIANPQLTDKLHVALKDNPLVKWDLQDRNFDLLLQGIISSHAITTVSPSYSREILTPEFGEGLHEVLNSCQGKMRGILNGIDYDIWDPATDKNLFKNFSLENENEEDVLGSRRKNKMQLQKELKLPEDPECFLLGSVGRLDSKQKGLFLIEKLIQKINQIPEGINLQFIVLGVGEKDWEDKLILAGKSLPNVRVINRFDSRLARMIFAGADSLLIPSRFEPCGLVQMQAMRYGSIPIVSAVGGLRDTVIDGENGIIFDPYTFESMMGSISRTYSLFLNSVLWQNLVITAMKERFAWDSSAEQFQEVYQSLI